MSDKLDRLLSALQRDPLLLFKVAVAIQEIKVAGPWVRRSKQGERERQDPNGRKVAFIKRVRTRSFNPWEASMKKFDPNEDRPEKHFMTEGEALSWADAYLITQNYLLAPDPG